MTEPTYTEADVREAIASKYHPDYHPDIANRIIDYLKRPKHDFAEGQVVARIDSRNPAVWSAYRSEKFYRHLNLTELGPHVKALRDAMVSISRQVHSSGSILGKIACSAIKAFDAAVGENNDSRN